MGDVTPKQSEDNDKRSTQVDDDINAITTQESTSTMTEPLNETTNKRKKWTIVEKKELYYCYCEAITRGLKATLGTYEILKERNPTNRPNIDANKLSNQRRIIEK